MAEIRHSLTIVNDTLIVRMLQNQAYRRAFPFLDQEANRLRNLGVACGKCGRANVSLMHIKAWVAGLGPTDQELLRRMLHTRRVRIVYRDADGKVQKKDF